MDVRKKFLLGTTDHEEMEKLKDMISESESLLRSWGAYRPDSEPQHSDAIVALFILQSAGRSRLAWLEGLYHEEELPF